MLTTLANLLVWAITLGAVLTLGGAVTLIIVSAVRQDFAWLVTKTGRFVILGMLGGGIALLTFAHLVLFYLLAGGSR